MEPTDNKKSVLVTGAAGYIGGHTCIALKEAGYHVIGIDRGFRHAPWAAAFCDIALDANFEDLRMEGTPLADVVGVLHIAGTSLVGPSIADPATYYYNNTGATAKFIRNLVDAGFRGNFIFSSSAAVYGDPGNNIAISEDCHHNPISPYGMSKSMAETVIAESAHAYGFKAACLRYFNACGADIDSRHGQIKGGTHLIARICENVINDGHLIINGNDYGTADGTCVRDYLHVMDIAQAHISALEGLTSTYDAFNLGTGLGWSILDVVKQAETVLERPIKHEFGPRREGDPAVLIANGRKFQNQFAWKPVYSRLDTMIATAWKWYNSKRLKEYK